MIPYCVYSGRDRRTGSSPERIFSTTAHPHSYSNTIHCQRIIAAFPEDWFAASTGLVSISFLLRADRDHCIPYAPSAHIQVVNLKAICLYHDPAGPAGFPPCGQILKGFPILILDSHIGRGMANGPPLRSILS